MQVVSLMRHVQRQAKRPGIQLVQVDERESDPMFPEAFDFEGFNFEGFNTGSSPA